MPEITVWGIVVGAGAAIGGAYFARRGQNFADKADVGDLTRLVENVRAEFRVADEHTRSAFAKDTATHVKRFEVELPIYRDLWNRFVDLERALGHVQVAAQVGVTTDKRSLSEAQAAFRSTLTALQDTMQRLEPFFSKEVSMALKQAQLPLRMIAAKSSIEGPSVTEAERNAKIEAQAKAVAEALYLASEAIRARLLADASVVPKRPAIQEVAKPAVVVRDDA